MGKDVIIKNKVMFILGVLLLITCISMLFGNVLGRAVYYMLH